MDDHRTQGTFLQISLHDRCPFWKISSSRLSSRKEPSQTFRRRFRSTQFSKAHVTEPQTHHCAVGKHINNTMQPQVLKKNPKGRDSNCRSAWGSGIAGLLKPSHESFQLKMTVLPSTLSTCIQDTEQKWFGNEILRRGCASETSSCKQTHTCGCSFPFLSSPCSKKQTNRLRLKSQQRAGAPIWWFCCIFPLKKQFDSSLLCLGASRGRQASELHCCLLTALVMFSGSFPPLLHYCYLV